MASADLFEVLLVANVDISRIRQGHLIDLDLVQRPDLPRTTKRFLLLRLDYGKRRRRALPLAK